MKISILSYLCICSITLGALHAGGKSSVEKATDGPMYVELASDEGLYNGVVYDAGQQITVTKLSFNGQTSIQGIKKESDNSHNKISLSDINSLNVLDPTYQSKRYPDQEYAKVAVVTTNGAREELLFPRNLTICAIANSNNISKAWYLRSINGLMVSHHISENIKTHIAHSQAHARSQPSPAVVTPQAQKTAELLSDILSEEEDEFDAHSYNEQISSGA